MLSLNMSLGMDMMFIFDRLIVTSPGNFLIVLLISWKQTFLGKHFGTEGMFYRNLYHIVGRGEIADFFIYFDAKNIPNFPEFVLWNIDVSQFCTGAKSTIRYLLNVIPTEIKNLYLHHIQFINLRNKRGTPYYWCWHDTRRVEENYFLPYSLLIFDCQLHQEWLIP